MLTLEPLFYEDATELLIDEVTWRPLPDIRETLPDIPPAIEAILNSALARDPAKRPTAAKMGRALDDWCAAQSVVATPDKLQEHLALIFPASYSPPTVANDEKTRFSNFRFGLKRGGERENWFSRTWRRMLG